MVGTNVCTVHHSVDLLAWYELYDFTITMLMILFNSASYQAIKLYNIESKDVVSNIKYHDGFMGQRIGPTKSLAFHPYKVGTSIIHFTIR